MTLEGNGLPSSCYVLLNAVPSLPHSRASPGLGCLVGLLSYFHPVLQSAHVLILRCSQGKMLLVLHSELMASGPVSIWQGGWWWAVSILSFSVWKMGGRKLNGCPWHLSPMVWYCEIVPRLLCGKDPVLLGKEEQQMVQGSSRLLTIKQMEKAPCSIHSTA